MIDYKKEINALNIPWVVSPFFNDIIKDINAPKRMVELAKDYNSKGYIVIDLGLPNDFVDHGPRRDLLQEVKLDSESLYMKIMEFVNE